VHYTVNASVRNTNPPVSALTAEKMPLHRVGSRI